MASSLTGSALQASRAALSSALAEHPASVVSDDASLEPGEIQEVDMQAQAEGIRTVFSDPTNFNVKVPLSIFFPALLLPPEPANSIRFTLHGLSGSTHPSPKAAISLKPPCRPSHRHQSRKPPARQLHRGGWRISNVLSTLTVWKNFGGRLSSFFRSLPDNPVDRLYNNIIPPSQLPQKANYYLFKVGKFRHARLSAISPEMINRKASSLRGRTKRTKTVGSGVSSFQETKTGLT